MQPQKWAERKKSMNTKYILRKQWLLCMTEPSGDV